MKLCLLLAITSCALGTRIYLPEEDDINYKRYHQLLTKQGNVETVDLLAGPVTARAAATDVTYYLYSKNNLEIPHTIKSTNPQELSASPNFNAKRKTVFIIHGWVDSYTADVNVLVKAAILRKLDVNVVVVDWSPIAALSYSTAQSSVVAIGNYVGSFVNGMIDAYGISGNDITLIGHSLGAHICGNAGAVIKSKVSQIIGLDPAAPSFTVQNTANRLDPSDAQYVQAIHTNGRFLGFSTSLGHVDYYPNGGMIQAGCGLDLLGGCSHARAFQYLADAIDGAKYTSTLCGSYSDFQNNKCTANKKSLLGSLTVDKSVVGDYFLNTRTAEPFALG